jgi:succinoglycan biosynthesis transport protein ExoP
MLEDFEKENSKSLDWRHYWAIARRRTWHFLVPLFVGWALVWGAGWLLRSRYRSTTLILVEQPTVPQQFVVPNVGGDLQDRLQSITQQILSRTRLLNIVEHFNLYPKEREHVSSDDLVERMRKDVEIELVRSPGRDELTAFNVSYVSENPQVAQQVTSELTNLFISENLEARQQLSVNTTEFLESQLEDARQALAAQEEKVRQFKDQHLGELPGQVQSNLQILGGLQSQLQSEEDALNRARQQGVYLESLMGQYRSTQRSTSKRDAAPMGLPAIDQEIDRLKAQLADLTSHYTDRHPDVRKLKEQIAEAEKMKQKALADLEANPSVPAGNTAESASPRDPSDAREITPLAELESQYKVNKIEIENRQHAIQELQVKIGQYQAHLNHAPALEEQLAALTRGYEQSQANYDSLLKKKNDSGLATSLEKRQQGEHFRVLDPPSLPVKPYFPNRLALFGIGLGVGLLLGGVMVAGAEMMDDRLYNEKELKDLTSAAVIVEIPRITTPEENRLQRRAIWLDSAAAAFVFGVLLFGALVSYLHG